MDKLPRDEGGGGGWGGVGSVMFTLMTLAPVGINREHGLLNRKLNFPAHPLFMKNYEDGI